MTTPAAVAPTPATVTPLPPVARFSLRLRPEDAPAATAALGFALPGRIGARTTEGARAALCLGPDEWLILAPEGEKAAILQAFAALTAAHALADISDRELAYALEGPDVLDLLATGCPLDLAALSVGDGVRTVFDTVQVVLVREDTARFRLEVWRSFAPHVGGLLGLATAELAAGL